MVQLRLLPFVAVGGAVGALARWGVLNWANPDLLATWVLGLNVVGSFLIGLLAGGSQRRADGRLPITRNRFLLLGTGFCGGLTTFSAYALEAATALDDGALQDAATFGFATPVLAVLFGGIGYRLAAPRRRSR